jgi:2-polyprenyl-3-methyl-5-hydroxy-6-metoxy-1,4-benzoquinol methylase
VIKVEQILGRGKPLRILDIASNDGSLLRKFKEKGHDVQGVDPAENLRPLSEAKGVPTVVAYWNEATLSKVGDKFDVIIAMNVLAHITYPMEFLLLCQRALKPGGRIYIQTSQAMMVRNGEFDTIYHEHHSFFTARSFIALASRAGLQVENIEHVPVHGTSYLVQLCPKGELAHGSGELQVAQQEERDGYYEISTYRKFASRAMLTKEKVVELVAWSRSGGYRIVGYGAAAKGMTFLNFAGLDMNYLIDDNPLKVGLLTPGRNIRIMGPEAIGEETHKTLFVILAWNFYGEIMQRIRERTDFVGHSYLTYFPRVELTGT